MTIIDVPPPTAGDLVDTGRDASPRRILIADDNRDGAETMSMLLSMSGHETHVAHTGTEALEIAGRLRPDIGLLDIGLPDFSGYQVAERIRHEAWGKDMLLIAITGWGQADDKRRAKASGFDHHLTKPVDPVELEALFAPVEGAARRR
jgi:CheY-like chemotaxis protein